jgi:glycosyltransferase involved in cell wall biosynthesis
MPKVSIIVPIYNVAGYLARSIQSLRDQTLEDLEIILVNDGSTDNSLCICEEHAKSDCRIQIIDKSNGGVSSARNVGLEVATGEYIGFVDPDDWVEPSMYESMYTKLTQTGTDLCMCNFIMEYPNRSVPVALPFGNQVL